MSPDEQLCRIYFDIAAGVLGEDEVRRLRDMAIEALAPPDPPSAPGHAPETVGGEVSAVIRDLHARLTATEQQLAEAQQTIAKRQRLIDDLYDLFTIPADEIFQRFGESRVKNDSHRLNYALEWIADLVSPTDPIEKQPKVES